MPALREEVHRRRRRAVFEPPGGRMVLKVLRVERERLGGREPARHRRLERRQQRPAGRTGTPAGPAAQELQGAGGVEVAPEVVQVQRDDAEPVVVVDEGERAALASHPQTAGASTIALER